MDKFKTKQAIFCQEPHVLTLANIVKVIISYLLKRVKFYSYNSAIFI